MTHTSVGAPLSSKERMSKRGAHGVAELVLTSRYCEETALRALRYFANFAFNVSLFLERIPLRKARKVPQSSRRRVVSKEGRPYRSITLSGRDDLRMALGYE